jgi:hypothetical protein
MYWFFCGTGKCSLVIFLVVSHNWLKKKDDFTYLAHLQHVKPLTERKLTDNICGQETPPLKHIRRASLFHLLTNPVNGPINLLLDEALEIFQVRLCHWTREESTPFTMLIWIAHVENARRFIGPDEGIVEGGFAERVAVRVDAFRA